jgi:hypothetical protein
MNLLPTNLGDISLGPSAPTLLPVSAAPRAFFALFQLHSVIVFHNCILAAQIKTRDLWLLERFIVCKNNSPGKEANKNFALLSLLQRERRKLNSSSSENYFCQ